MKKMKILPLLLATTLLAGCSGTQTGLRSPKDFAGEGKDVTFKDGSVSFVTKFTEAKFDEWKFDNYSVSESEYYKETDVLSHTKANIGLKRFEESCSSRAETYDKTTKCIMGDINYYSADYVDGNRYDKENNTVEDVSYENEDSYSTLGIGYVEGNTMYEFSPSSRTYVTEEITGYDFEKVAAARYAKLINEYEIPLFAVALKALEGSTEDVYKAAWRSMLTEGEILPEEVKGETFKLKQNEKVFTVSLEQTRSADNHGYKGTLNLSMRVQVILDANSFTANMESTTKFEATGDGLSADDKVKFSCEVYDHRAEWIDMGGSVEKPKLENYMKVTSSN